MKQPFIVLEGLSASGKSTICRLLAEKIGAVLYTSPSVLYDPIRKSIDQKADVNARFFFYLSSNIQSSIEIEQICETKPVVCDRYFISTVCTHKVMDVDTDNFIMIENLPIIAPDFYFLITCNEEIRIRRMNERGLDHNDKREIILNSDERTLKEYKKYGQLIEIDNSSDDPMDAVNKIVSLINAKNLN